MTGFPESVRRIIAARANQHPMLGVAAPVCEVMARCHGAKADTIHHRLPRGRGGTKRAFVNQAANGLAICEQDHSWLESYREKAREFGWLISQFSPRLPAEIPLLYRGRWAMLSDSGDVIYVPKPAGVA